MENKIIKSKAAITADMLSSADTTIDELLSKDVCDAQIEEMAKDLKTCLPNNWYWQKTVDTDTYLVAKHFHNQGYRKMQKDSVVLSTEEYKILIVKEKEKHWLETCMSVWKNAKIDAIRETAKMIIKWFKENSVCIPSDEDINEFVKQFDVEVEE